MSPAHPPGWRPHRRGDCTEVPRPCPYVSCRYNLYFDQQGQPGPDGRPIRTGRPRRTNPIPVQEPHEMADSCALDVADQGPKTCEEVGRVLGIKDRQFVHLSIQRLLRRVTLPDAVKDELERLTEARDEAAAPYRGLGADGQSWGLTFGADESGGQAIKRKGAE